MGGKCRQAGRERAAAARKVGAPQVSSRYIFLARRDAAARIPPRRASHGRPRGLSAYSRKTADQGDRRRKRRGTKRGTKKRGRARRATDRATFLPANPKARRRGAPRIAAPKEARNPARERAARSPKSHETYRAADQAKRKTATQARRRGIKGDPRRASHRQRRNRMHQESG